MTRVAAIAFDAAERSVVERLMAEGELPNLRRLSERGARCRLQSPVPYRSELPWTQFITGRGPQTNGYWGTAVYDPRTYEAHCVGSHETTPFYALGDEIPTIAFDIPHSVLAEDVGGPQVTAWGAHSPQYPRASLPPGLLQHIDAVVGPHPAFDNDCEIGWYSTPYVDNLSDAMVEGAERRIEAVRLLQERSPEWRLLVTVMSEIHSGGHHLWHGVDPEHPLYGHATSERAGERLRQLFRTLDDGLGRFVASCPDDTVVCVFAVHGMGPADDLTSMVQLPELLHRLHTGRAALRSPDRRAWEANGMPPLVLSEDEIWVDWMRARFRDTPRDQVKSLAYRALGPRLHRGLLQRLGKATRRPPGELHEPIPAESDDPQRDAAAFRLGFDWCVNWWYRRHWADMRAFALPTFTDGHVRVNLRGREGRGIVDVDDYARAIDEVIEQVSRCTDVRTGRPILADAIRMRRTREEILDLEGPDADLVLHWSGAFDAIDHPDAGTIGPFPFMRSGSHTTNGWAVFAGPDVAPADLGEHAAEDLTPTLLGLLGVAPTPDMDGRPIPVRQGAPASSG